MIFGEVCRWTVSVKIEPAATEATALFSHEQIKFLINKVGALWLKHTAKSPRGRQEILLKPEREAQPSSKLEM